MKASDKETGIGIFGAAGDVALCVWFLLVALGFFGPYFNLNLTPAPVDGKPVFGPLEGLYALFLLLSIAALALRLLKKRDSVAASAAAEGSDREADTEGRQALPRGD